jgi:nitrogen fixation NifU-like protein
VDAPGNAGQGTVESVAGEAQPIDVDSLGELAALQGVVKFPVRIKCATLSWNTLAQGLDEAEAGVPAG